MSENDTTHRSGVFITTGDIYKELMAIKESVTRIKAQIAVLAFIVAPVISTVASTTVVSIMNGA